LPRVRIWFALAFVLALAAWAQEAVQSPTARELTAMLRQFLSDASAGNLADFEHFFADDVIYTRSAGVVTNKAEILKNVGTLRPTAEGKTVYSAEDITVHEYGDTAIALFVWWNEPSTATARSRSKTTAAQGHFCGEMENGR
jgi:ketosteroid isomerase-like protein